jgi:Fe-S oxidoreductase
VKQSDANRFIEGCLNGEPAPCECACPFHFSIRSFLKRASNEEWDRAYKIMQKELIFPEIASRICKGICQSQCRRILIGGEPLDIPAIERVCLENASKKLPLYYVPPKDERIAVVGAGLAGLSCALLLSQQRFNVVVFEKSKHLGGRLRQRIDNGQAFQDDISMQFSMLNTEFKKEVEIHDPRALLKNFQAVYVATGGNGQDFGLLKAWNPHSFSTHVEGIFLGGELCGFSEVEALSSGIIVSKIIASFIQTGNVNYTVAQIKESWTTQGKTVGDRVIDEDRNNNSLGNVRTSEEAAKEASRCMQCDCMVCIENCELLSKYNKKPQRMAIDVFMDSQARRNSITTCSITRQTYSCNLCGRCQRNCPAGCDIGGLFQMSREDRVERGYFPPALHDYWLRNMRFATIDLGYVSPLKSTYAFFPGCQLGADSPQRVVEVVNYLREKLNVGLFLGCCGVPALWAGERAKFESVLDSIRDNWMSLGSPTLILACATCMKLFQQFLPEIPVISLYVVLNHFKIVPRVSINSEVTVFDPCASDQYDVKNAVRLLAMKAGVTISSYDSDNKCCGNGGHMMLADTVLYQKIAENRAWESDLPYIVYCSNCREVFARKGKKTYHLLDIIFDIECEAMPSLSKKKRNMIELRKEVAKLYGEEYSYSCKKWESIRLEVSEAVCNKMDDNLIDEDDIRETIWTAESTGDGFINADGSILCSLVRSALTYWVLYFVKGEVFVVQDVYCHRMRVRE